MTPEIIRAPARKQSGVQIIQTSGLNFTNPSSLFQAPPNAIRGIAPASSAWWTAGQPILPIAPRETSPRGWQFLSEQNKIFTPRATEWLTFDDLRRLAAYPLASIMITEHANQIAARKWAIRLRQIPGVKNKEREAAEQNDKKIQQLTSFFMNPNPDCTWREFIYQWIYEIQTTDAPALFIRRNAKRDIAELRLLDGAMIARYIDDNGWTPTNESPAYAQLWWGTPAWDLKRDQLFYRPKNPRVNKLYGNPPTEKMAQLLELGWARLELKKQWAENGTIPDGLMVVPPGAPMELVERQQAWMNSVMTGNPQRRVQLRLIQGFSKDGKDQLLFPKEKMLTDPYDEWETRTLAVGYGVPKQRFMAQMNRASAESAQEAAEEEGYWPSQQYVMDSINTLIQSPLYFNLPAYEFAYADVREKDVLKQAQADDLDIKNGISTWNEKRDDRGLDPYEADAGANNLADGPLAFANPVYNAYKSADQAAAAKAPKALPSGNEPTATEGSSSVRGDVLPPNKPPKKTRLAGRLIIGEEEIEGANKSQVNRFLAGSQLDSKFDKAHPRITIDPQHFSLQGETARNKIETAVSNHLDKVSKAFVAKLKEVRGTNKVRKTDDSDIKKLLDDDEFWNSLWIDLPPNVSEQLKNAVLAGMSKGMMEVSVSTTSADAIQEYNTVAHDFAEKRAAEMVGMAYDDYGELIPNPRAQYVISETTRDELRTIITEAFEQNTPISEIITDIQNAGAFSPVRAQMIAATEVSRAQVSGNLDVWKKTGVVKRTNWQTSNAPGVCEDCEAFAEGGPYDLADTPVPVLDSHPRCRCVLVGLTTTGKPS